jgi:hypothetical protein
MSSKVVESGADRTFAIIQERLAAHGAVAHVPSQASTFKSVFYGPYKHDNYYCVIVSSKSGDRWRGMRCFNTAMETLHPDWPMLRAVPGENRPSFHPIFDGLAWFGNQLELRGYPRILSSETIVLFQRLLPADNPITDLGVERTLQRAARLAALDELGVKEKLQLGRLREDIAFIEAQVNSGVPISMLLALYKTPENDLV